MLRDRLLLKVGRTKIRKQVAAGIVVEASRRTQPPALKNGSRTDHSRPGRRNVEGLDLRALIGRPDGFTELVSTPACRLSNEFGV
jgi:hypothetical protein